MARWLLAGTCALAVLGCGGDEKDSASECAPGIPVNGVQVCTCPDGVTTGNQICQADGLFAACIPCNAVAPTGGAGGTMPVVTGGTGGTTGGTGGTAGTAGTGGTGGTGGDASVDDDAGATDSGTDAGTDAGTSAGDQDGPCLAGDTCNGSLVCYTFGGFCSEPCANDTDCDVLTGADYTCYTMDGVCRVQCDSANGNADCPAGMECADVGGGSERCRIP